MSIFYLIFYTFYKNDILMTVQRERYSISFTNVYIMFFFKEESLAGICF